MQILDAFLRALLAIVAVNAFYSAVKTRWPENYYLLDDAVSSKIARTWWSYGLFRFMPLFLASVCAMAHVRGGWGDRALVATLIAAGHGLSALIRINPFGEATVPRTRSWCLLQTAVICVAVSSCFAATWVVAWIDPVLPRWSDYVSAVVTAALVVCFGTLVIGATGNNALSDDRLQSLIEKYWELVSEIAVRQCVSREFALSVVIVEDVQRPGWFRSIERRLAWTGLARTFGVGQQLEAPGSVREAIEGLVDRIGDTTNERDQTLSRPKMIVAAERLNDGDGYVEFVMRTFDRIRQKYKFATKVGDDGSQILFGMSAKLEHGSWRIKGDADGSVEALALVNERTAERLMIELAVRGRGRKNWSTLVPVEWESFSVWPLPQAMTEMTQEEGYNWRLSYYPHVG